MEQEIITQLIKKLFESVEELHQEYTDDDIQYVIDVEKKDNEIFVHITLKENEDKKKFEQFVDSLDDDLFQEVWESLSEEDGLHTLSEIYESEDYQKVIDKFKARTKEIAQEKINELHKILEA